MKCEFCALQAATHTPMHMCTGHAIDFWRKVLIVNRQEIDRRVAWEESVAARRESVLSV